MGWTMNDVEIYLQRQAGKNTLSLEAALLTEILAMARPLGWLCYHTHDSRRSAAGFPDLVLVNATRVIFAELKTRTGKVTAEQELWLTVLRHTEKVEVYLWRPADLAQIQTILEGQKV